MSETSKLSGSFYELNYLVSEETALRLRDFVREYLELDENGVGKPNFEFPVHTLYLDSPDFLLYRQAVNDIEHRRQLRVRYYSQDPETPVNLEIKRRIAEGVIRESCAVSRRNLGLVLSGQLLSPNQLIFPSGGQLRALERFVELIESIQARPKLRIRFQREAYLSDDDAVRITMDRRIRCQPTAAEDLDYDSMETCGLFTPEVLLELSFRRRYPHWFGEMVRHFSLMEREADKYVDGITALGRRIRGLPG